MRDQLLLALILSLSATACNSFQGLAGKKSSDAAAVTAPGDSSGDVAKGADPAKSKSCPVEVEGEDDGDYEEAEKKAAKERGKTDDYELSLTDDETEIESDDCANKETEDE